MLEVEVQTDCNPQHLFMMHIDTVLNLPKVGVDITCQTCRRKAKIMKVGVPGRIREPKPVSKNQTSLKE